MESRSPSFTSTPLILMNFNLSSSIHAARSISPSALPPLRHASASSPLHPLSYQISPPPPQPLCQALDDLALLKSPFPFDLLCTPHASLLLDLPSPRPRLHFTANLFFRPTHLSLVSSLAALLGRPRPFYRHPLCLALPCIPIPGHLLPISRLHENV